MERIGSSCPGGEQFTTERENERANCLPQQASSSERTDRIKNRARVGACGFGVGPTIVKKRLISIGSHSHREAEQGRTGPSLHLLKAATWGATRGNLGTEVWILSVKKLVILCCDVVPYNFVPQSPAKREIYLKFNLNLLL